MEKWGNRLIITLVFTYILNQFLNVQFLHIVNTVLTIVVMLFTITNSNRLPKIFSTIIVTLGAIILLTKKIDIDLLIESVTKNLPLVCLIIIVPVLAVPINIGKYNEKIAEFFSKFNNKPTILYMIIHSFFYILGPITNLGSIHIINSMIEKMKLPASFLGRVYIRGFSSINTWAPYFASVFLVVYTLDIPMYVFLPYGVLLSFFQFATSTALFSVKEVHHIEFQRIETTNGGSSKKVIELLFALLLLIGIIFMTEPFITINVSVLIIIVASVFALLWSVYLKETKQFLKETNQFRKNFIHKQSNEIGLFLSAGFFGVILSKSPVAEYINLVWVQFAGLSMFFLILFTIMLVSLLSFFGIHQIVIISSILATVSPESLGINDITFAMILLSAWAIASTISPIAPMNVISSNILHVNVFQMIFKWNFLYAVIITLVHTVVIYAIHLLFR